jgi:hypothetical protein
MSTLAIFLALLTSPAAPVSAPATTAIAPGVSPGVRLGGGGPALGAVADSDWKANESDNIAGLTDLKKLSNPAVVDYDALLAATAEMKQIERERIDPDSTKGRSLRQQAADRVTKAADAIRKEKRHCSVWKQISHKDGRKVPDITQAVKDKLDSV